MFIFLICALPLLSIYLFRKKTQQNTQPRFYLLFSSCGFMVAALLCTYYSLFSFSTAISTASFLQAFMYILIRKIVLPQLLCSVVIYFLLTIPIKNKIELYLPFFLAFYAVYVPYDVIMVAEIFSFYQLFCKPLVYGLMILCCYTLLTTLSKRQGSGDVKHALPKIVVLFVLSVAFPALIETLWIENILHIGWAVVFAGYIIFSVMLFLHSKTNEMI